LLPALTGPAEGLTGEYDMSKMPTLFIPHGGGPCFFMDWDPPETWDDMANYLRGVPGDVGRTPEAMVVISGHWEESTVTVQSNPAPELLFDYYGFPDSTYLLEYPAPGAPKVTERIVGLLAESGIECRQDSQRGFDHGVFIPLKVAFPEAKIPIVQLSMRADLDPASHIAIGRAIEPLREEGILIVGSGLSYHNMNTMMRHMHGGSSVVRLPESEMFDDWLSTTVVDPDPEARNQALIAWEQAPAARDAHPREDHFLPLHVVAGAAGGDVGRKMYGGAVLGAAMSAFQFG